MNIFKYLFQKKELTPVQKKDLSNDLKKYEEKLKQLKENPKKHSCNEECRIHTNNELVYKIRDIKKQLNI